MASRVVLAVLLCAVITSSQSSKPVPLVIWHGMGDTCCNPISIGSIMNLIKSKVPGIYIHSIEIGNTFIEDMLSGFFTNSNTQIDMACSMLSADTNLKNGFNAMGFSQGGQFLRALIQRCDKVKVFNLLSVGGQHQGVYGFPRCPAINSSFSFICETVRRLLDVGAYDSFVQEHLVQAEYWQDPFDETKYVDDCTFLPDINQEKTFKPEYKERFSKVSNVVLVKFENDTMVQPKESEWFGFYKEGQDKETYTLQESKIWTKDLLGLQGLSSANRLHFLPAPFDHLRFTEQWFLDNLLPFIDVSLDEAHRPIKPLNSI